MLPAPTPASMPALCACTAIKPHTSTPTQALVLHLPSLLAPSLLSIACSHQPCSSLHVCVCVLQCCSSCVFMLPSCHCSSSCLPVYLLHALNSCPSSLHACLLHDIMLTCCLHPLLLSCLLCVPALTSSPTPPHPPKLLFCIFPPYLLLHC